MGRTHTKKIEAREARLKTLPRAERLAKTAEIKKKEGRVLDASEKHALKMTTEYGDILRLWEVLRAQPRDDANALKKKQKWLAKKELKAKASAAAAKKKDQGSRTSFGDEEESESDDESSASEAEETTTTAAAAAKGGEEAPKKKERTVERYEHKYPVIDKLLAIISPKFDSLAKTPRVSRVIQSMIKYGSPKHLEKLVALLKSDFAAMCNDAFAHFLVAALVRHAPHQLFKTVLAQLVPVIPQLVTHKFGIRVVHAAYSHRLCSTQERQILLLGVFKDSVAVMKHWRGYPVLENILDEELDHRKRLLSRLFDLSDKLVSNKDAVSFPFVQRLVYAFLKHGTKHEILEMAITLKPHLVALCETKEGSPLASLAFSLLEAKARKDSLRQFGEKLEALATSKYGAPVVARLFDVVYDAQLLDKYVAGFFRARMALVLRNPYAYCILLHILTPTPSRREHLPLLSSWEDHQLYYTGSTTWNVHTWLNVEQEKETVELVSKPADKTHLAILGPVVRAFITTLEQAATATGEDAKIDKQYAALIAREVLYAHEHMPAYRAVYALTPANLTLLKQSLPNKDQKAQKEEGAADVKGSAKKAAAPVAVVASPAAASKKRSLSVANAEESTPQRPSKKARSESGVVTSPQQTAATPLAVPRSASKQQQSAATPPPRTPQSVIKAQRTSTSGAPSQSVLSASPAQRRSVAVAEDDDAPVERSARSNAAKKAPEAAVAASPAAGKKAKGSLPRMK